MLWSSVWRRDLCQSQLLNPDVRMKIRCNWVFYPLVPFGCTWRGVTIFQGGGRRIPTCISVKWEQTLSRYKLLNLSPEQVLFVKVACEDLIIFQVAVISSKRCHKSQQTIRILLRNVTFYPQFFSLMCVCVGCSLESSLSFIFTTRHWTSGADGDARCQSLQQIEASERYLITDTAALWLWRPNAFSFQGQTSLKTINSRINFFPTFCRLFPVWGNRNASGWFQTPTYLSFGLKHVDFLIVVQSELAHVQISYS